jgi:hypothetical protein
MVIDDDSDTTLTFKKGLEAENYKSDNNNRFFEVYTYSHAELALSEFTTLLLLLPSHAI